MDTNQKLFEDVAPNSIAERQQFEQPHGRFEENDTDSQQQSEQQHSKFDEFDNVEIQKYKEKHRESIEVLEGGNQSSVLTSTSLIEQTSGSWEVFEGDNVSYDLASASLHEQISGNQDSFLQLETKLDGAKTFLDHAKGQVFEADSQIAKIRQVSDGLSSVILEAWSGLTSLQNYLRLQREEYQKQRQILQENLEEIQTELDAEECLPKDVNDSKKLLQVVQSLCFLEEQLSKKNIMLTQLSEAQDHLCIALNEKEKQLLTSKEYLDKDTQLLQEESHQIHENLRYPISEMTSTANELQQWCASANQQMIERGLVLDYLQSELAYASSTLMNLKFTKDQREPAPDSTSGVIQSKTSFKMLDGDSRENQSEFTECHLLHTEKTYDNSTGSEKNVILEDGYGEQQDISDVVECNFPCEEMPPTTLRSQMRETIQVFIKPEVSTSSVKRVSVELVSGASDEQCKSAFREIGLEIADTISLDQQVYDLHEKDQTAVKGLGIGSPTSRPRSSKDHIRDSKQLKPMAYIEVPSGCFPKNKSNDVNDDEADAESSIKRKELMPEEEYSIRDAMECSIRSKEKPPIMSESQMLNVYQVSVPDTSYIAKQTEASTSGEQKKIDVRQNTLNLRDARMLTKKDYSVVEDNESAAPNIRLGGRDSSLASLKYETADSDKQKVVIVATTSLEGLNSVSNMLDNPPCMEPTMSLHREVKSSDVNEAETRKERKRVFTRNEENKNEQSRSSGGRNVNFTEVPSFFNPVWTKMDEEPLAFKEDMKLKGQPKQELEKNLKESYDAIHQLASRPELPQRFEDKTNQDEEPLECLIEGDDDMLPLQMFEKARYFLKQKKKFLRDLRQATKKVKSRESVCFGLESTLSRVQNLLLDVQNAFEDTGNMNSKSLLQLHQAYKEILAAQEALVWTKRVACEDKVCRAKQDTGHENQTPASTQTENLQEVLSDMVCNQHQTSPNCIKKKLALERDGELTWLAYRWDQTDQNDQSIRKTLNHSKERQLKLLRDYLNLQREQNLKLKQQVAQLCEEADKGKQLLGLEKLELEKLRREIRFLSKRLSKEARDLIDFHSVAIKAKDLVIETLNCEIKALVTRYEMKDEINHIGFETQKITSLEGRFQSQFQMLCTMQEHMADMVTQTRSQVRELKEATKSRDAVIVELRALQNELKLAMQRLEQMAAEKQMLILNLEKKENDLMELQEQNVSLVCEKMALEDSAEALALSYCRLCRHDLGKFSATFVCERNPLGIHSHSPSLSIVLQQATLVVVGFFVCH